MEDIGGIYYVLKDHLGSTRVVINESGQAVENFDFDAFGNLMNARVTTDVAYQYTGQEFDWETGLHNYRARMYDSSLRRFYAVDPLHQFASPYSYVGNNPISFVDPKGMYYIYIWIYTGITTYWYTDKDGNYIEGEADTWEYRKFWIDDPGGPNGGNGNIKGHGSGNGNSYGSELGCVQRGLQLVYNAAVAYNPTSIASMVSHGVSQGVDFIRIIIIGITSPLPYDEMTLKIIKEDSDSAGVIVNEKYYIDKITRMQRIGQN